MGNICRSPLAEGIFRNGLAQTPGLDWFVMVDSAGTGNWHAG
jgi:protein-tyrosine phosphatase